MHIFENAQNRPLSRQAIEPIEYGCKDLAALLLGAQRERRIAPSERYREERGKERCHGGNRRRARCQHGFQLVEPPLGRIVRLDLGRALELGGEGVERSEEHTSELQSRFGISYAV